MNQLRNKDCRKHIKSNLGKEGNGLLRVKGSSFKESSSK